MEDAKTKSEKVGASMSGVISQDAAVRLELSGDLMKGVLRSLMLLNGGAILSLLTFVGNSKEVAEPQAIFWAFVWFILAILILIISHFLAYISQSCIFTYMQKWAVLSKQLEAGLELDSAKELGGSEVGQIFLYACYGLTMLSFALFAAGSFVALDGIT